MLNIEKNCDKNLIFVDRISHIHNRVKRKFLFVIYEKYDCTSVELADLIFLFAPSVIVLTPTDPTAEKWDSDGERIEYFAENRQAFEAIMERYRCCRALLSYYAVPKDGKEDDAIVEFEDFNDDLGWNIYPKKITLDEVEAKLKEYKPAEGPEQG